MQSCYDNSFSLQKIRTGSYPEKGAFWREISRAFDLYNESVKINISITNAEKRFILY